MRLVLVPLAIVSGCSGAGGVYFADGGANANVDEEDPNGQGAGLGDAGKSSDARARGDARRESGATDGGDDSDVGGFDAAPAGPRKTGTISVGQTITTINGGPQYYSSYATAMFTETQPGAAGSNCTTTHVGACDVYACALNGPTPDAGAVRYAGAGEIDITGGFFDYSLSTSAGTYVTVSQQQLLYQQGTVLYVSGTGAEVPAFSNKALIVPGSFTVSSPSSGSTLALPRTQALALAWFGASGRTVNVNVSTIQQNVKSVTIACKFPGSSGSASVPAAAMNRLLPSGSGTYGTVSIAAPAETIFNAGAWQITFALYGSSWTNSFSTTN